MSKISTIKGIECTGNAYDFEACNYLAQEVIQNRAGETLESADFSDMFPVENIEEHAIPTSLSVLIDALPKHLVSLNVS